MSVWHHGLELNESLGEICKKRRSAGQRIVFTNGCFDILHVGHLNTLLEARSCGDVLVVGVNSDASVSRLKGDGRPLNRESERARLLSAICCVDYVSLFPEDTPSRLIQVVRPDVLVKGGDYRLDQIAGRDFVERRGGEVRVIPYFEGRSTTSLLERIRLQ